MNPTWKKTVAKILPEVILNHMAYYLVYEIRLIKIKLKKPTCVHSFQKSAFGRSLGPVLMSILRSLPGGSRAPVASDVRTDLKIQW